jgi:hypothetical protein
MAKAAKKKKASPKRTVKAGDDVNAKRAKAYAEMEPHVSDLVSMGTIAMDQFDKDKGLFIFAVSKLEDMLKEFSAHYYAEEFPS